MSSRASAWFEAKYKTGAIHVLQDEGYRLKGTFQDASNINGLTVTWKLAGAGTASQMSDAIEERPVMNADRSVVTATLLDWEANEWINQIDLDKMSEQEQQIAQQTAGYALGRKFDNLIMAEFDTQAGAITTVGTGAANISPLDLLDAQSQMLAQGILGDQTINVGMPFKWFAALLLYREVSSADFVSADYPMLRKLGARNWMGMNLIPMPDSQFAVPAGGQQDGYMWFKSAVGFATNYDMRSRIDYVATKKAYFAGNTMSGVAKTLLAPGVRRLRFASNVALARPTP